MTRAGVEEGSGQVDAILQSAYQFATVKPALKLAFLLSILAASASLVGCASGPPDGTVPAEGLYGDPDMGQDRLWEVHSRTLRELTY
ncbi:MAG: hypothetical protein KDN19_10225 [Verrucomicrobiae bacterium]|nr:hypothetical protein [Verrucomicrobiae bacterium]